MKKHISAILLAVICANSALAQSSTKHIPENLRSIIGVTHVNGHYHLTDKDFLSEGADRILALGSRVIKVWFHKPWRLAGMAPGREQLIIMYRAYWNRSSSRSGSAPPAL